MTDKFAIPSDLSPRACEAAEIILAQVRNMGLEDDISGRMFYSPSEWRERGERFGLNADLIVVHDDGFKLAPFHAAKQELGKKGFYYEEAETWYSVVLNESLFDRTKRGE